MKLGDRNADLISDLLDIQKYDHNHKKGLCPWHEEDTPSFIYNPKSYGFKCFGCGRNTDLIDALMHKGKTYLEAVETLFKTANVPYSFGEKGVKTKMRHKYPNPIPLNDRENAFAYLAKRGISQQTAEYADVREDNHGNIAFNFYDENDVLGLVKYRPSRKIDKGSGDLKTWCQKDADTIPLLFNMNRTNTEHPLLITEGECFKGDAEVLTPNGWVRLDAYAGEQVAQVNEDLIIEFVTPIAYINKEYDDNLFIKRRGGNYSTITTSGHNIVYQDDKGKFRKTEACKMPDNLKGTIPTTAFHNGKGIPLTNTQLALYIAVSADCTIEERKSGERYSRFVVKKEKKYERMKYLLTSCGIEFYDTPQVPSNPELKYIGFKTPDWIEGKQFPMGWIGESTFNQKQFIIKELLFWDGNMVANRNQGEFTSKDDHNAVFVQTIAHTSGNMSTIIKREKDGFRWNKTSLLFGKQSVTWTGGYDEISPYTGRVFCVTVPTGMIMVRIEEHISISGNCDALAAIEAGYPNTVSVPFGANNYTWIEENYDWLEQFPSIIICSDNDEAGIKMQKECVPRLGSWRTKLINIPYQVTKKDGTIVYTKDLNEILFWQGKNAVMDLILNASDTPVEGVIDFSDIEDIDLDEVDGIETGIADIDKKLMRLFDGTFTIVTGINGCVDKDTEYFNGTQWKPICKYREGERVLQYNIETEEATLTTPLDYIKLPAETIYEFGSYDLHQCLSPEHRVLWYDENNTPNVNTFEEIKQSHEHTTEGFHGRINTAFTYSGKGVDYNYQIIRTICKAVYEGDTTFDETWYNCNDEQLQIIADEFLFLSGNNEFVITTTDKTTADFVQFAFSATSTNASIIYLTTLWETKSLWGVVVGDERYLPFSQKKNKTRILERKTEDGFKYCFTVETDTLVLRKGGKIFITKNSGKSSFLSQLICNALDQGKNAFLYSGELPNFQSKNWINYILAGQRNLKQYQYNGEPFWKITHTAKRKICEHYRQKLFIHKDGHDHKASTLLTKMIETTRKYGCKLHIIDNLTSVNLEHNDNNKYQKQEEFVADLISFAKQYNAVVVLVVHPHKMDTMRRMNKMDIQGISAIIDLAHRIISLYRVSNADKAGTPKNNGEWFRDPIPYDVLCDVLKDRLLGHEGYSVGLYYDKPSRRFFSNEIDLDKHYKWDTEEYTNELPFPPAQLIAEREIYGIIDKDKKVKNDKD